MKTTLLMMLLSALPARAALVTYEKTVSGGTVTFLRDDKMTPEQFSAAPARQKPDQALLQNRYPLTTAMRNALTAEDFKNMTQEEIDQVYIRLTSGPIVPANYQGSVIVRGELAKRAKEALLKDYRGIRLLEKVCGQNVVECLGEIGWKGKRIYPQDPATGEYQLRNAISKKLAMAVKTALLPLRDQIDPENWLTRTTGVFFGETKFMLFPAHVYCGQSLMDHRRESIIIDYSWGSDFKPYIKGIDNLAGREFLDVRDEVRMVRPGLYLGRAYMMKIFALNFTLTNPDAEKAAKSGSWPVDACAVGKSAR